MRFMCTGLWLGVNMGNKTWLVGGSAWDKLPWDTALMCWWVVQDLPSRWYENTDGNQGVPCNGHKGNADISKLFKVFI